MPKKLNKELEQYKTSEDRTDFLSDKYGKKDKAKVEGKNNKSEGFMQGLRSEKLKALCKKYINKKPSKKFIDSVKSQGWYQIECPECGFSNRKWLEAGKDAFYYPIEVEEISTKTKLRILYFCRNCNISWEG